MPSETKIQDEPLENQSLDQDIEQKPSLTISQFQPENQKKIETSKKYAGNKEKQERLSEIDYSKQISKEVNKKILRSSWIFGLVGIGFGILIAFLVFLIKKSSKR